MLLMPRACERKSLTFWEVSGFLFTHWLRGEVQAPASLQLGCRALEVLDRGRDRWLSVRSTGGRIRAVPLQTSAARYFH
jgi:hypothetical protein